MQVLATLLVLVYCCYTCTAVLSVGRFIPTTWGPNYQHESSVKDPDDCRFGYVINKLTRRVLQVVNCTRDDPDIFFTLKFKVCGTMDSIRPYTTETCSNTPRLAESDTDVIENDPSCFNSRMDVAPDPSNCARYLQCYRNDRRGSKDCGRGLYFSITSYRCEYMWQSDSTGTLVSLTLQQMCQNRTLPANLQKNVGAIMTKCYWGMDASNAATYRVSEPLDCQLSYLCSRYNPSSIGTSDVSQCGAGLYWSDSRQDCVTGDRLNTNEARDCGVTV